jgi:hypothetical protein
MALGFPFLTVTVIGSIAPEPLGVENEPPEHRIAEAVAVQPVCLPFVATLPFHL